MQSESSAIANYISIVSRRKGLLLSIVVGVSSLFAILAFLLPSIYRSTAIILIEQQSVPQELVRSTVTTFVDQRIQLIRQRVMSRENLLGVIGAHSLYTEESATESSQAILKRFRKSINMETVTADVIDPRNGRPSTATIAFMLSFDHDDPAVAKKVTEELVSLFLEENIKSRLETASDTSDFLANEAEKLSVSIGYIEEELAAFKDTNSGALPELAQLNLRRLESDQRALGDVEREIRGLVERKMSLLSDSTSVLVDPADRLRALKAEYFSLASVYSSNHPDLMRLKREIETLEGGLGITTSATELRVELGRVRAELSAAEERYSADHPDVIRLVRAERDLEAQLAANPPELSTSIPTRNQNSGYSVLDEQLRALQARKSKLESRINLHERRLERMPGVEIQYRTLQREHENLVTKYNEIRAKQTEAQLAQALESTDRSERFILIEAPQVADEPIKPHRLGIFALGFLFAVAAGLGVATVIERMDDTIYDRSRLSALSGIPTLATVPDVDRLDSGEATASPFKIIPLLLAVVGGTVLVYHLVARTGIAS
ncbi:MAG: hypothetical protein AAF438_04605 [Pseudomonadota bacterium]